MKDMATRGRMAEESRERISSKLPALSDDGVGSKEAGSIQECICEGEFPEHCGPECDCFHHLLTSRQLDSTCNHDPACSCDICNKIRDVERAAKVVADGPAEGIATCHHPIGSSACKLELGHNGTHEPRSKNSYSKIMGSGWFWCHHLTIGGFSEWSVFYVNALWGARVDGKYVRMDNFDDVVGPLEAPNDK